jgi:thiamine kinase
VTGALHDELRERALALVPGWKETTQPRECVPLSGGTSNAAYRVRTRAGDFVLRLHEPQSALLGVNRANELALHEAAARAGIAPPLVVIDPAGQFLITQYVRGPTWTAGDMADPTHLAHLGRTLRELHALPAPTVAGYEPARLLRVHAERIARLDGPGAALLAPWLQQADEVLARCARAGRLPAIIHNDLHHSNILEADRLYLIDWEYAAVSDPLFDLACLIAYYPAAEEHAELLLDAAGLPRSALGSLREAAWLYVLLSYLWYRALALQSAPSAAARAQEQALLQRLLHGSDRCLHP